MKQITLPDFLTPGQIDAAWQIYLANQPSPAKKIRDEVIAPNMEEINRKLGQENDPSYLAYACEHVFNQMPKNGPAPGRN